MKLPATSSYSIQTTVTNIIRVSDCSILAPKFLPGVCGSFDADMLPNSFTN